MSFCYKYIYFFLLSLLVVSTSCNNASTDSSNSSTSAPPASSSNQASPYPPLPADRIQALAVSTGVDFLFYQLPISMNLHEAGSIQRSLVYIDPQGPAQLNCKKAIGRIFYQKDGETLIEADIFFEKGCAYLLFLEKGKAAYANKLSSLGIQFFQGSIQQATGVLIEP